MCRFNAMPSETEATEIELKHSLRDHKLACKGPAPSVRYCNLDPIHLLSASKGAKRIACDVGSCDVHISRHF